MIEDTKFSLQLLYENNKLTLNFLCGEILNINFSYAFALCLGKTLNHLSNDPRMWSDKQEKDSKLADMSNFEYIIQNKLEIPIEAWLTIEQTPDKWVIAPQGFYHFSQTFLNTLHALSNKKSKATLTMNNIEVPTKLGYKFSGNNQNVYYSIIDEVSKNIITVSSDNAQFPCFINILSQEGKRLIIFDTAYFVSNNCSVDASIKYKNQSILINPMTFISLPIN